MLITKEGNPGLYKKILDARRASVIEAAKTVYQAEQGVIKKKAECEAAMAKISPINTAVKLECQEKQIVSEEHNGEGQLVYEKQSKQNKSALDYIEHFEGELKQFKKSVEDCNLVGKSLANSSDFLIALQPLKWVSGVDREFYFDTIQLDSNLAKERMIAAQRPRKNLDLLFRTLRVTLYAGVGVVLTVMVHPIFFLLLILPSLMLFVTGRNAPIDSFVVDDYIVSENPIVPVEELDTIFSTGDASLDTNKIELTKGVVAKTGLFRSLRSFILPCFAEQDNDFTCESVKA